MQDITRLIGISTGTFYIYFKNKRDLFTEVVDAVFRTIIYDAAKALLDESDPLQRLKIRGRVFYKNYSKFNEILYQLRSELASEYSWPQANIKRDYLELTKPVIRELDGAISKNLFRPVDPDLLAYTLTGLIEIMSLRLKLDNKYTYDDVEKFLLNLLLHGFGAEKSVES